MARFLNPREVCFSLLISSMLSPLSFLKLYLILTLPPVLSQTHWLFFLHHSYRPLSLVSPCFLDSLGLLPNLSVIMCEHFNPNHTHNFDFLTETERSLVSLCEQLNIREPTSPVPPVGIGGFTTRRSNGSDWVLALCNEASPYFFPPSSVVHTHWTIFAHEYWVPAACNCRKGSRFVTLSYYLNQSYVML